jgi:ArsR family transcriptional regulator
MAIQGDSAVFDIRMQSLKVGEEAEVAATASALAHPVRVRILARLAGSEMKVSQMQEELGIRQPLLSQNLAKLRDAALVYTRRGGRHVYYSLSPRGEEALTGFWRMVGPLLAASGICSQHTLTRNVHAEAASTGHQCAPDSNAPTAWAQQPPCPLKAARSR